MKTYVRIIEDTIPYLIVGGSFTNFPKNTSIFYLFLSTSFYYYHPFYGIFRKCLPPVILPPTIRHGRVLVLIGLVPIERSTLVVHRVFELFSYLDWIYIFSPRSPFLCYLVYQTCTPRGSYSTRKWINLFYHKIYSKLLFRSSNAHIL